MATVHFSAHILESHLLSNHNSLVQSLEEEYRNHIAKLLQQKNKILQKLQKLYRVQKNYIHQTVSQQIHKKETRTNMNHSVVHSSNITVSTMPMHSDSSKLIMRNERNETVENVNLSSNLSQAIVVDIESTTPINIKLPKLKLSEHVQSFDIHCILGKDSETKSETTEYHRGRPVKYKCPHCKYKTWCRQHLVVHLRTHSGQKPFECYNDGCNKRFTQKSNMHKHAKHHCKKGKKEELPMVKCKYCNIEFSRRDECAKHIQKDHSEKRPYRCDFENCKRGFTTKYLLNAHMKKCHIEKELDSDDCEMANN